MKLPLPYNYQRKNVHAHLRMQKAVPFLVSELINLGVRLRRSKILPSGMKELDEIRLHARKWSDLSDHLENLFVLAMEQRPRLIVELGVRGGESTLVFDHVARICHSKIVSVDLEDCTDITNFSNWTFVQKDDVQFGREFGEWCREHNTDSKIDLLFLDTSHFFEHTLKEIEAWFPWLSDRGIVCFHDTNMRRIYRRRDGSRGVGWNNHRGVIRAIEQYFHKAFDERQDFVDLCNGWIIEHHANCSGLTVLKKIKVSEVER
ncbi:MAG: class I SAM-dependent methyltransferase [Patescibacteria group bacterium]